MHSHTMAEFTSITIYSQLNIDSQQTTRYIQMATLRQFTIFLKQEHIGDM